MARYFLIQFITILLSVVALSNSQLLAIDFGTQFIKASVVHSGAGKSFSIVQNSKSQRKFLNALGFYAEQRFYQSDALSKRTKYPENCFLYSRLLIDFAKTPSMIKIIKKDLYLEYANQNLEDQFIAEFILKGFPQDTRELTLLQVMTMILKYVKLEAQKFVKGPIKDAVLILPNYWTIHQRNFLLQAASVADIYILSIVNENTAASINYAVSQRTQNKTQKVLFFNVGSNSLQMTLVQYKQIQVQSSPKPVESIFVKDDYGLPYVGGLRLDSIICKHFEEIFEQKYKKKLDKRGLIKLLAESNKVKQTLSANKQASLFVEGIMDGVDFHSKMTRAEFQVKAQPVFKQIIAPLKRFLLENDIKSEDLHSVQLIGGGSRIPKLQSMIVDILNSPKQKIGTHINGDEAMALGGAFFAANSSKKFKVKGINLYDGFNFDIRLVLKNLDQNIKEGDKDYFYKNATIFKKKNRFGLNKQVNFKCLVNLRVDLYKIDLDTLEQQLLKSYELDNVQSFNQTDFKISLIFTIDPLEVVLLKDSKFNYKKDEIQSYIEKVPKKITKNNTSEQKHLDQTQTQKQDPKEQSEEQKSGSKKSQKQVQKENQKQNISNQTKRREKKKKEQKIEYQTIQKNKTVTKKYQKQLKNRLSFNVKGKQEQLNQRTREMVKAYEKAEQKKRNLAEAKNKLQALIYQTKDKLENQQFIRYSKKTQRQNLGLLAQQKQTWQYESQSKNPEDYKRQYNELSKPLQRIKKRIVEHYEREHIRDKALSIVKEHLNLTSSIRKGKEWITEQQVEELQKAFVEAEKKIKDIFKSMEQTELSKDTTYENKDMIRQAEVAKDKYFVLKAKSKPFKKQSQNQEKKSNQEESVESNSQGQYKKQKVTDEEL